MHRLTTALTAFWHIMKDKDFVFWTPTNGITADISGEDINKYLNDTNALIDIYEDYLSMERLSNDAKEALK